MNSVPLSLWRLARPLNGLIALLGVALGAELGVRARPPGWTRHDVWSTVAVGVATMLTLAAGNALNDLCDEEIDRLNRPDRPIPSGELARWQAAIFAAVCVVLGSIVAVAVGRMALAVAAGAALLLGAYAFALKRTALGGNIVVAALSGGTLLAGGVAVGASRYAWTPILLVALFSATREVVKDLEDAEGDARFGARTAAVAWGPHAAACVACAFAGVGVAASLVPFLAGWAGFGWRYLAIVVLGVDLLVAASLWRVLRRPHPDVARNAQRWIKVSMFFGLLAVFVG